MLFIGGTGRCGTSITRSLLEKNPQVAALPFESRFLIDPDGVIDFWQCYSTSWSPFVADKRIKRLEQFLRKLSSQNSLSRFVGKLFRSLKLSQRSLLTPMQYDRYALKEFIPDLVGRIDQLIERLVSFSYAASWVGTESLQYRPKLYHAQAASRVEIQEILREFTWPIFNTLLEHGKSEIYVEDNTWNSLFITELFELFPNSKYLQVNRDPRDVVTSFLSQKWCPSELEHACQYYSDLMSHWFAARDRLSTDHYKEVKIEDMVRKHEQVITDVCDFGGISFHSDMMKTPLSDSSFGRWRRDLTSDEQLQVNERLKFFVEELGYNQGES